MSNFKKMRQKILPKNGKRKDTVPLTFLDNPTDIRKIENGTDIKDIKTTVEEFPVKTVTAAQAARIWRSNRKPKGS